MTIHISPTRKLAYELGNIKCSLQSYKYGGTGLNLWEGLRFAIEKNDKRGIIYCLSELERWYASEISSMTNQYNTTHKLGFRVDDHKRVYRVISQLRKDIEAEYSNPRPVKSTPPKIALKENDVTEKPLIFLSHSSSDTKYGDAIRDFIVGLGVKNEQLIYTSHPLHGIPTDTNIYAYLREKINADVFMIFLWSDEYLERPACLNEMGAAWLVQCDYTNIYVPDFSFENKKYKQCAVDTERMGIILNGDETCKQRLLELKTKIVNMFGLEIAENQVIYLLDRFIKDITEEMIPSISDDDIDPTVSATNKLALALKPYQNK